MLLLLALSAHAELPLPPFPDCGPEDTSACPSELPGNWELISWIPEKGQGAIRPEELELGSGIGLDQAIRHTAGRWDVTIAVLDSGAMWGDSRLDYTTRLNAGELPLPQRADGTEVEDLDGNGLLTLADWAEDPRVDITSGVDRADSRLDPSDLIHTFSDGVDDDGNGYTDDIAGWDFFQWDNDPFAVLQDGYAWHGTGVMRGAAEEGGNGSGIGTCPNCSILPLRVGDHFVSDGDRVALAIAYATDAGASVVGMAIGSLSHHQATREALDWADAHDVVLVGAAGDENSWHHNAPAWDDPILYVHAVRANNAGEGGSGVYSYFNHQNCGNFGPRMDLVGASDSCATGATSRITGGVGLVVSAGRDAGLDLSGDEVRALLKTLADDVWLSDEDLERTNAYPSRQGWDAFYGYGRADVGRAVPAVFAGEIPPVARLTSPRWFSWTHGLVEVEGRVSTRTDSVSWVVELGRGAEPDTWEEVLAGEGSAEGVLGEVDVSEWIVDPPGDLEGNSVVDRMHRAHEAMVHLRLRATDAQGRVSEDRRGLWAAVDPDLLPGFPLSLGGSGEASPVMADLDGDGILEVVVGTGSGQVHVLDGSGSELPGFPVSSDPIPALSELRGEAFTSGVVSPESAQGFIASPAVGDLDGDGSPEVVAASLRGQVYAWHADGTPIQGWPISLLARTHEEQVQSMSWDEGAIGAPSLGDVDGDGDLEVVLAGLDQRLYAWDGDGALLEGYPMSTLCQHCDSVGYRMVGSPSLGDVDGDGHLDAVVVSNEIPDDGTGLVWVVDLAEARVHDGWPVIRDGMLEMTLLPVIGEGHPSATALADLDGDGLPEIASAAILGPVHLLDAGGAEVLAPTPTGTGRDSNFDSAWLSMATHPALADVDGDEVPDILMGGAGIDYLISLAMAQDQPHQQPLAGWSGADGEPLKGFPRQVDDGAFLTAPAVADVTGDGVPEIIYGTAGHYLYAWNADGELAPGWPKLTGGWLLGGPAVGDIDGDGWLDVVASTREGWLLAWTTAGRADQAVGWASAFHDAQNSGNSATPLPAQEGPVEEIEEPGGCCKGKGDGSAAWLLLPLLPLWMRRRG